MFCGPDISVSTVIKGSWKTLTMLARCRFDQSQRYNLENVSLHSRDSKIDQFLFFAVNSKFTTDAINNSKKLSFTKITGWTEYTNCSSNGLKLSLLWEVTLSCMLVHASIAYWLCLEIKWTPEQRDTIGEQWPECRMLSTGTKPLSSYDHSALLVRASISAGRDGGRVLWIPAHFQWTFHRTYLYKHKHTQPPCEIFS